MASRMNGNALGSPKDDLTRNGHSTPPRDNGHAFESGMADDGIAISQKQALTTGHDERVKWRAKRPSQKIAELNGLVGSPTAEEKLLNGTMTRGILVTNPKKYAKNSRRPRGRYGRGLPKKGE